MNRRVRLSSKDQPCETEITRKANWARFKGTEVVIGPPTTPVLQAFVCGTKVMYPVLSTTYLDAYQEPELGRLQIFVCEHMIEEL